MRQNKKIVEKCLNISLWRFEYTLENKQTGRFCSFHRTELIHCEQKNKKNKNALWTEIATFSLLCFSLLFFCIIVPSYDKVRFVRFLIFSWGSEFQLSKMRNPYLRVKTKLNIFKSCLALRPSSR